MCAWRGPAEAISSPRDGDRQALVSLTRSSTVMARSAQRARIVLLASEGVSNTETAEHAGVSRPTVIGWRARCEQFALAGQASNGQLFPR